MSIYDKCERVHGDPEGLIDFIARAGQELATAQDSLAVAPALTMRVPLSGTVQLGFEN